MKRNRLAAALIVVIAAAALYGNESSQQMCTSTTQGCMQLSGQDCLGLTPCSGSSYRCADGGPNTPPFSCMCAPTREDVDCDSANLEIKTNCGTRFVSGCVPNGFGCVYDKVHEENTHEDCLAMYCDDCPPR